MKNLQKRQNLTTVVKEAGEKLEKRHIALAKGNTKPDFVFLGSAMMKIF